MEHIDESGPAFPVVPQAVTNPFNPNERIFHHGHYGLSKREWFAGMALQGILAGRNEHTNTSDVFIATAAFAYADEMLKAGES